MFSNLNSFSKRFLSFWWHAVSRKSVHIERERNKISWLFSFLLSFFLSVSLSISTKDQVTETTFVFTYTIVVSLRLPILHAFSNFDYFYSESFHSSTSICNRAYFLHDVLKLSFLAVCTSVHMSVRMSSCLHVPKPEQIRFFLSSFFLWLEIANTFEFSKKFP